MTEYKLEKATCIYFEQIFYVVVKSDLAGVSCICDHANNVYYWEFDVIKQDPHHLIIPPLNAAKIFSHYCASSFLTDEEYEIFVNHGARERKIPGDVMLEVLVGMHDERFSR